MSHAFSNTKEEGFSFKELLEKRKQIMRERDEYIEIPLNTMKETKTTQTLPELQAHPELQDQLQTQVQTQPRKKTNKSCKYITCTISIVGLIILNDYILLTFFI